MKWNALNTYTSTLISKISKINPLINKLIQKPKSWIYFLDYNVYLLGIAALAKIAQFIRS